MRTLNSPVVTFCVPVLNAERYLDVCLRSIFSQDFDDFQVQLLDGGSLDGSVDIAESWQRRDSRLSIHREAGSRPGGVYRAFNDLMRLTDTEFFTFCARR